MAEDEDGGSADEPEDGAEGGREPEEGDADHEEAGVERLLGDRVLADLDRVGRCWYIVCRFCARFWCGRVRDGFWFGVDWVQSGESEAVEGELSGAREVGRIDRGRCSRGSCIGLM